MSVTVLAARIAHFQALCEDIRQECQLGLLRPTDVRALSDELASVGTSATLRPYVRGLLNQAMARAEGIEHQLSAAEPIFITQHLRTAVSNLCETLGWLKVELEVDRA